MDPTVVALIGTLCGGVGLKVAEYWLSKGRVKIDEASKLRDELRQELTAMRAENRALEAEVDKWRKEYYDMYGVLIKLQADFALLSGRDPPTK